MKIRVRRRGSRDSPKQAFLWWAECLFFLIGCLTLGFCAFAYFEAGVYQASEAHRFYHPSLTGAEAPQTLSIATRDGSPISRIEIPRIGVSAIVVEGVAPRSLRLAVGHVPSTALPGESGNIGIAGHRDTFFRTLRHIRGHDRITLTTVHGSYEYLVESTQIVDPTDVQALQASSEPILTLITCYPFYFVGPAPRRFIVRARQIAGTEF